MELIKLTFSGDIMLNAEIINSYREENKFNFNSIFEDVKGFLEDSDFVVGNLETPISEDYKDIKSEKYKFTSPIEFAEAVKNAGFDFVSTANNHCLDNGIIGIKKTIEALEKVEIGHTGISYREDKLVIHNLKNIKVAILAYTYGTNAFSNKVYLTHKEKIYKVNLFQNQELSNVFTRKLYQSRNILLRILKKILRKLKLLQLNKPIYERKEKSYKQKKEIIKKIEKCRELGADYIIMCMHEGGQYNDVVLKKTKKTARFLYKNGVDLIVGNHEHVIHGVEIKEGKIISYSLGNFVSTHGVINAPFDKMSEYSILLNVYISKTQQKVEVIKKTFTIVKTVVDKEKSANSIKVRLLMDIIKESLDENERNKLLRANKKIVKIVTGKDIELENIQKEYEIEEIY